MIEPHVNMHDPAGPWVEYDDGDDLGTVESHVPGEWRARWAHAVRLPSGRLRAPLFHLVEVVIERDPAGGWTYEELVREVKKRT